MYTCVNLYYIVLNIELYKYIKTHIYIYIHYIYIYIPESLLAPFVSVAFSFWSPYVSFQPCYGFVSYLVTMLNRPA